MIEKKNYLGFGFLPEESLHHFLVVIPKSIRENVTVFERFEWQTEVEIQTKDLLQPKVEVYPEKWAKVKDALAEELNNRLRKQNRPTSKWKVGQTPMERLLGKELVLLLWAIEDADPTLADNAVRNWQGLSPEERWWLFTMTNATSGSLKDKRGWRKAVRFALTENQMSIYRNEKEEQFHALFREGMDQ